MLLGTDKRVAWLPIAIGLVAAGIVLLRLPIAHGAFDRIWAEDGAVFLADARAHGVASLIRVYSGYAHGVPRVLALVGSWLPLPWFSAYVAIATALVTGLLATYVFGVARALTPSLVWAAAAALALVLLPAQRAESLGNLSNLQWMLLAACAWAVVDRRRDDLSRCCTVAVCFAAAITSPLAALALPALIVVQGRGALRNAATAGLAAGLALQVLAIAFAPHSMANPTERNSGLRLGMLRDVVRQLGDVALIDKPVLVGGVLALTVLAASLFGARRDRRVAALVLTGGLVIVVPMVINGSAQPRYTAAGFAIVVGATCLAAVGLDRKAAGVVAVVFMAAAAMGFAPSAYRSSGPSWSAEVDEIETSCPTDQPMVHYSPAGWPPVTFPC